MQKYPRVCWFGYLHLKSLVFPDDWKYYGKRFPVFKVGERKNRNNYRPISVLLTVSRVFKKLVYEQVYHYLIINNVRSTSIWLQFPSVNSNRPSWSYQSTYFNINRELISVISEKSTLKCGVPQGCIIGPLLLLIYMILVIFSNYWMRLTIEWGCYPPRLKAEVDNTLRDLQNSSYPAIRQIQ